MKSVSISNYSKEGKLYTVTLGNNHYFEFTNEKKLNSFLVETTQFLTRQHVWINQLISDVYRRWRDITFYLDGSRGSAADKKMSLRIRDNITDCEDVFERVVEMSNSTNGNHNVFKQMFYILDRLKDTVAALTQIYKRRSMTQQHYECGSLMQQLQIVYNSLLNYGIDRAHGVSKPDFRFADAFDADQWRINQDKTLKAISA